MGVIEGLKVWLQEQLKPPNVAIGFDSEAKLPLPENIKIGVIEVLGKIKELEIENTVFIKTAMFEFYKPHKY